MHTNPSWKDWFVFSKKERNAFVILLAAIVIIILTQLLYLPSDDEVLIENLDQKMAGLSVQNQSDHSQQSIPTAKANSSSLQPFSFDPNTLNEAGFAALGLRDKTIHTIINYRNKGGQFRTAEDIRKIYGLKKEEADALIPFIQISLPQRNKYSQKNAESNQSKFIYSKAKPQIIDINTATVDQWKALPAIGDALSNRILNYRDKMGGFSSVEQVKKTYGLSDSAYHIILPYLTLSSKKTTVFSSAFSSKKININTASAAELKTNSDIPSEVAEAIVIYRKQHGNYASVADVKKIVFINEQLYQKVAPYLTVD